MSKPHRAHPRAGTAGPPLPMRRNRWVRLRIYVSATMMTLLLGALAYRAFGIQVSESAYYRELARRQHLGTLEIPAPRGVIYDAKGRELAVTANTDSVYASPKEIQNLSGTAEALAETLDLDVRSLEARLSAERHFVWVKRRVTVKEAKAVKELGLPGIALMPEPRRYYPDKSLAATVLGFANIDGTGLDGIELSMNDLLAGRRTKMTALRDARGNVTLADGAVRFRPGASITLTIDSSIQFIAERALAETVETHRAKAGTAIVLDVATAEVLALANWPTFDPNKPGDAARNHARNHAVTDAYEIGSVMKVFTVAAALEAGVVRSDTVIDVEGGRYRVGRKVIRDSHHDQELSVGGVIKRSSNVGAAKIAQRLGPEALHAALLHYRFGKQTGIELPGEREGLVRPPNRWGQIGLATIAFGYGFTATPIQVAAGFAAIGNGGIYHEPRLVKRVNDADGSLLYEHTADGERIISSETTREILPMLASVFEKGKHGGTARSITVEGFRAGGKTGTAHKVDPATGRYSNDLYLSSFVGIAPIDEPRIVVLVVIDEPHGDEYYGAKVAAPAFARITSEALRYLGVPASEPAKPEAARDETAATPEESPDSAAAETPGTEALTTVMTSNPDDANAVLVPDFSGLGIARALQVAREHGLEIEIEGTGRVVSQVPSPGLASAPRSCKLVFSQEEP